MEQRLRVLFVMRNVGYIRNFDSVIRLLSARGHSIHLVIDTPKMTEHEKPAAAHLEQLMRTYSNVTFDELIPSAGARPLKIATRVIRLMRDYSRYLDPIYADAPKLRARARSRLSPGLRWIIDRFGKTAASRRAIATFLNGLDHLIPAPSKTIAYLRRQSPDLVMVTPLLGLGSLQPDYIKACRQLGIRSCLPVASWDNLTNKGLIHLAPDRVLVWNEAQKQEAIRLHELPPDSVIVTGAHTYDHWFSWRPSSSPEEFKKRVGLDPDKPFILYLGSSGFIAPDEPRIALRWAHALRGSDDRLVKEVGILIRPHPQNAAGWQKTEVSPLGNVAIYPPKGANAVGEQAKSDYYDSMFHCAVAVGINTSGMIEAGILGKAVHTVLFDEAAETQEGTLHFHHLTSCNGGLLHISRSLEEHTDMLSQDLRKPANVGDVKSHAFVAAFVRPSHLKKVPTEIFVEAVEEQLSSPAPRPYSPRAQLGHLATAPLVKFCPPKLRRALSRQPKQP